MKSRNILILALIMALITTFFFSRYLKGLDEKYKKNDNRVSVVVAKQPIAKNEKVTKEMLEIKDLSVDSVLQEAIKKVQDIEGSYALIDMKQGEVLLASRFTSQFTETELVTRKIREGLRAVSIEVNFVESVSNLIEPEDYVDVVFSEKLGTSGTTSQVVTQILLQNARVLAVGTRITASEGQKDSKDEEAKASEAKASDGVEYISVTLELKPEDVARIINADERGNLKLILRSKVAQ